MSNILIFIIIIFIILIITIISFLFYNQTQQQKQIQNQLQKLENIDKINLKNIKTGCKRGALFGALNGLSFDLRLPKDNNLEAENIQNYNLKDVLYGNITNPIDHYLLKTSLIGCVGGAGLGVII